MKRNICIFGDSITWGSSDFEKSGWVERLKSYCIEKYDDINIYNLGIPGSTTIDLLKRIKNEAIIRKADIIIFAIGINDSSYVEDKNNVDKNLQKFNKNILKIIKLSKKIAKQTIFIGLTRVDEKKTELIDFSCKRFFYNEVIEKYDDEMKDMCIKNKLNYIEMKNIVETDDLDDGIHPNSIGHEKIYKQVLINIQKLFS